MRVIVCPADTGGSGYYRLRWPARVLRAHGFDVDVFDSEQGEHALVCRWQRDPNGVEHVVGIEHVEDCDVMVLQRPLRYDLVEVIPHLRARGVAVVVEVDDDFSVLDPRNVAAQKLRSDPTRDPAHLAAACRMADGVTATTRALLDRYARPGRGHLLPNCVPERYLRTKPAEQWDGLRLGWTGSVHTHPTDLQVTHGRVNRAAVRWDAATQQEVVLQVLGTGDAAAAALGWTGPLITKEWVGIMEYPAHMACCDVGIVPLADTAFNRAKSCLKLLEFSALGIAAVASPSPDNQRIHAEGAGVLAKSPGDWERQVRSLLFDADRREDVAGLSRRAAERWTIEQHADRWWDAWAAAAEHHAKERKVRA